MARANTSTVETEDTVKPPPKPNGASDPAEAVDPLSVFDNLDAIRRNVSTDLINEKSVLVHLPVRKPQPREYFRMCDNPAMSINMGVFIHKVEGQIGEEVYYILPGSPAERYLEAKEEMRTVQIVLCVNRHRVWFLWALPVHGGDGPVPGYISSARTVAHAALSKWVRLKWRRALGAYDLQVAEGLDQVPEWPDMTFSELLKLAFKDRFIQDLDHSVMMELRGIKATPKPGEAKADGWFTA